MIEIDVLCLADTIDNVILSVRSKFSFEMERIVADLLWQMDLFSSRSRRINTSQSNRGTKIKKNSDYVRLPSAVQKYTSADYAVFRAAKDE